MASTLCIRYGLCGPPTRLAGSTWQMEHTENCNFDIRSINPLSYVPILPYPSTLSPLSYLSSITTCLCPPTPETIEWFIEDQVFSRSYDSAPRPPFPPLPSASCLSFSDFCVSPVELTDEIGGERAGWGLGGKITKSYNREKAWPSIHHSLLSALHQRKWKRRTLYVVFVLPILSAAGLCRETLWDAQSPPVPPLSQSNRYYHPTPPTSPIPTSVSWSQPLKKVIDIPVHSRDVAYQSLLGREKLNYSRPGRVW